MELFLRQQFEVLLLDAAANFTERIVHRCGGADPALTRLAHDPDGPGVHRAEFVTSFFSENLLDNPAGHAFVLEALPQREVPPDPGGAVSDVLGRLAVAAFADVLTAKAAQSIQQQQIYS